MAMIPNRELANKKLLEELELNKKLMKQGGVAPLNSQNSLQASSNSANKKPTTNLQSDTPVLSASQRIALNAALTQSNGFFIPQDSAFGNLILPVLPRFDEK